MKFPRPTNVHGIRQFIGLASYFRKFIKNFAMIARPLTNMLQKSTDWRWEAAEESSFETLKETLANRPLLALYDGEAPIEVNTDASKIGLGAMLLQQQPNGDWRPIFYYGRTTTTGEQSYHSYELETLAIVEAEAVKKWRVYLIGVHFKMGTDCSAVHDDGKVCDDGKA